MCYVTKRNAYSNHAMVNETNTQTLTRLQPCNGRSLKCDVTTVCCFCFNHTAACMPVALSFVYLKTQTITNPQETERSLLCGRRQAWSRNRFPRIWASGQRKKINDMFYFVLRFVSLDFRCLAKETHTAS